MKHLSLRDSLFPGIMGATRSSGTDFDSCIAFVCVGGVVAEGLTSEGRKCWGMHSDKKKETGAATSLETHRLCRWVGLHFGKYRLHQMHGKLRYDPVIRASKQWMRAGRQETASEGMSKSTHTTLGTRMPPIQITHTGTPCPCHAIWVDRVPIEGLALQVVLIV